MRRPLTIVSWLAAAISGLVPSAPLAAQEYHLRHYTVDDGLPHSQVHDLTQDRHGRMWFATRAGVASYDGRDWHTYSVADGLSWADQAALRWVDAGSLWSVSSNAPFKIFNFDRDRWTERPGPAIRSDDCRVTSFDVAGHPTSAPRIAIGTDRCGLFVGRGDDWRQARRTDGLPDDGVVGLVSREGGLLVATPGGLVELRGDGVDGPFAEVAGATDLDGLRGLALEPKSDGDALWLVGEDWIGQLTGGRFQLLDDALPLAGRPAAQPVAARPDGEGGLYLADPSLVAYYHPEQGLELLGRRNGLPSDGATSLWMDLEGNLWLGSARGATKIVSRRFGKYTRRQGIFDDEVTAVLERASGEIVLGHRGGLSFLDGGEVVRTLALSPYARAATDRRGGPLTGNPAGHSEPERVRDLAEDAAGDLWIAADSYGLARLDARGTVTWLGAADGLRGAVTSVRAGARGGLWAATDEGLFARRRDGFEKIGPRFHVRRIFQDHAGGGAVLLATAAGLRRFDGSGWQTWTCECSQGREADSVFAALPLGNGDLWVGTSDGLYRTAGGALVPVREPAVDDSIFFMTRDHQGRVWFGTGNGVRRWDGRRLRHLSVHDGLAGREIHRAAGLVDSRGDVWIGSDRGVTVYSERLPEPSRSPPIVELAAVEVGGRQRPLDEPLALDYHDNDLTFHFRVVSLIDEDRLSVKIRLAGADKDWILLANPNDRQIRYPNLRPDTYRFALDAANAAGVWHGEVISKPITVAPPYWQQSWFYAALASALVAVFYSGQRVLAQRRYSRRLESEVASRVAELRASEERYRHTFERSQAVKLLVDAGSLEILDANRAACRFYGYTAVELRGRSLDDLRVEPPQEESGSIDLTTKTGTHLMAEQHRRADGQVRDVELYASATEIRGRTVYYVIVQDVTELRLAEESMAAERARLAATLHHIDDGVITTDADGRILLLNRKAQEITGWTRFQAVGEHLGKVLRLHQESDDDALGPPLSLSVTADVLQPIHGAVLLTKKGQHRLVELSGSPIRKADEISGLVLAFRDIGERRRLENELARSQRLEALGLLAGGIAHDFNNLLTVLLGNLSLIGRTADGDPRRAKNLTDAETAVLRARDLTQQLLTFSRGGAPIREAAAITEVITDSASFILSGSKVRCEIDLPDDLRMVEIDAGQISQVINNLLINAIQAMPNGGVVKIRGENLDGAPSSLPAGRWVAIHVVDQGVGIPREYLPRIFDPYFSTKDEGRGLGLASAYSIAKQHDGLLTVASQPGRGATFTLYLPASDRKATAPAAPAELPVGRGRILVMDDEEEVRAVTAAMAERLGYQVDQAADGEAALELYRQARGRGEPYDVVVMDLTIPGSLGGQEAIRQLLALDPSARAIVASGYSNDPVLASFREHGFAGRIAKPFQLDDLARALHEVLAPS